MFNLKDLQNAKAKAKEVRENKLENVYDEAFELLDSFVKTSEKEILKEAGEKFIESIKRDKNYYPAYFCLSYIFYVLDNGECALKYLEKGEEICPEITTEFTTLKQKILKDKDILKENIIGKNILETEPKKSIIKPISSVKKIVK